MRILRPKGVTQIKNRTQILDLEFKEQISKLRNRSGLNRDLGGAAVKYIYFKKYPCVRGGLIIIRHPILANLNLHPHFSVYTFLPRLFFNMYFAQLIKLSLWDDQPITNQCLCLTQTRKAGHKRS